MPFIGVGEAVRLYHEDGSFDKGKVHSVSSDGQRVIVEFYDWWEEWDDGDHDFIFDHVFLECRDVLTPIRRGVIVKKYLS
jgi:hypothetical protein